MNTPMNEVEMNVVEYAKWFITLELYGKNFDDKFIRSVVESDDDATEKQMEALTRVVEALDIKTKVDKYITTDKKPILDEELEMDINDENSTCYVSGDFLGEDKCVFDGLKQRFMSVESFKEQCRKPYVKKTKTKKSMSDFIKT